MESSLLHIYTVYDLECIFLVHCMFLFSTVAKLIPKCLLGNARVVKIHKSFTYHHFFLNTSLFLTISLGKKQDLGTHKKIQFIYCLVEIKILVKKTWQINVHRETKNTLFFVQMNNSAPLLANLQNLPVHAWCY